MTLLEYPDAQSEKESSAGVKVTASHRGSLVGEASKQNSISGTAGRVVRPPNKVAYQHIANKLALIFCEEFMKRFIRGNNEFSFLSSSSRVAGTCCTEDCALIPESKTHVCHEETECSSETTCKYPFLVFLGYQKVRELFRDLEINGCLGCR